MRFPLRAWQDIVGAFSRKHPKKSKSESKKRANRLGRNMRMESLEDRRLMSTVYWDPDAILAGNNISTGAGLEGTGTWSNGGAANWYDPSTGTDRAWNNANGDDAVFLGTAGAVSLGSGVTAHSIAFGTSSYLLQSNTLTLTGSATVDVGAGLSDTISSVVAGSAGLTKTDSGTLALNGTNTFTGGTTLGAGTLSINTGRSLGAVPGSASANLTFTGDATLQDTGATLSLSANRNLVVNAGVNATIDTGANSLTVNGSIADSSSSFNLIKQGSGLLVLAGSTDNQHLLLDAEAGTVQLGKASSATVHAAAGITNIASGATVKMTGAGTTQIDGAAADNSGAVNLGGGTFDLDGHGESFNELIGLTGTVTNSSATGATLSLGGSNGSGTFAGVIQNGAGAVALNKSGSGTLGLTGANTFTGGTILSGGTLAINADAALGAVPGSPATNLHFTGSAKLQDVGSALTLSANRNIVVDAGLTVTVDTGSDTMTFNDALAFNAAATSVLVKNGSGRLVLGGTTDNVHLLLDAEAGTVQLNKSTGTLVRAVYGITNIASGATVQLTGADTDEICGSIGSGAQGLVVMGGGTLDLSGNSEALDRLTGTGTVTDSASSTISTLTLGAANGSSTFSGTLQDGSGTLALTKGGTGTLTLAGTSSYTGATTVSSGTLQLAAVAAAASGSTYSVTSTLDLDGNSLTIGGLAGTTTTAIVTDSVASTTSTLTVGANNASTSYSGKLQNGTGVLALTKSGSGTLTLSGTNSYTGATTISTGTLKLGIPAAVSSTSSFIVNGTLDLASRSVSLAELSGSGTITNSSSATTATLTDGSDNASTTFSGNIQDGAGLVAVTKSGTGTLTLSGANTFSGATAIFAGILQAGSSGGLSANSAITVSATLDLNGQSDSAASLAGAGTITNSAGSTTGTLSVGGNNASTTFSGTLQDGAGAVALTKTGTGTLTLSGTNTYSGETTISAGALKSTSAAAISANSGFAVNGTLDLTGHSITLGDLSGSGTVTSTLSGTYTLTAGGDNASTNFSGTIQNGIGTLGLTKTGTGALTLSGTDTYTGATNISAGTLKTGSATALSSGTALTVSGTLDLDGQNLTRTAIAGTGTITNSAASTPATLTMNVSGSGTLATNLQSGAGVLNLTKTGAGTLILSGDDHLATGTFEVSGGTLVLANSSAASAAAKWKTDAGTALQAKADADLGELTGDAGSSLSATSDAASPVTFHVGALNTDATYAGDIKNNKQETALDKEGTGALQLTGNNSYTGPTTSNGSSTQNPSVGPILQGMAYYDVTIGSGTHGSAGMTLTADSIAAITTRSVYASGWTDAVMQVLEGSVTTSVDPTTGRAYTYNFISQFVTNQSNQHPVNSNSSAFLITNQFYLAGVPQTGEFLALEDRYDSGSSDYDYDDDYWTITVTPSTPPTTDCAICDAIALAQGSTATPSGNMNGASTTGAIAVSIQSPSPGQVTNNNSTPSAGSGVATEPELLPEDKITNWSDPNGVLITEGPNGESFVRVGADPTHSTWIDYAPDGASANSQEVLTHDTTDDSYTLSDPSGETYTFYGLALSQPDLLAGQYKSSTDPSGNTTAVTMSGGSQLITTPTDSSGTDIKTEKTDYLSSGPNAGLRSTTTESTTSGTSAPVITRITNYTYYSNGNSGGNQGDLKSAIVTDVSGNVLDTQYFTYYTATTLNGSGDQIGYKDAVKMEFGTDSVARFTAAGLTITSSDADLLPYADQYFEYNAQQQVSTHMVQGEGCSVCSGGEGVYAYAYSTNPSLANPDPTGDPQRYNVWSNKMVETLPDGNTNTLYTNRFGQTILSIFTDTTTGEQTADFYEYGTGSGVGFQPAGLQVLHANPSAIASISESNPDLVTLYTDQGLIETTGYYTTTTATDTTAGGVAGYQKDSFVQQGSAGTPILQNFEDYFSRTGASSTIFVVADSIAYATTTGSDDPSRTDHAGEELTSYAYTWFSGTTQMASMATTLPVVGTDQNGTGASDVSTEVFDTFGREIWSKDAAGFISYTEYDPTTGAVIESIQDVDTSAIPGGSLEANSLPSGWTTPTGGGLNLITTYQVDSLGRTTATTDPLGNTTFTVYNDIDHETRTYSGFTVDAMTGKYVQMASPPPTQVSRQDLPGNYYESLTMSVTPTVDATTGAPTGAEAISNVQSLSRTLMNAAGQTIETDAYFDLSGITYSASSVRLGTQNVNYYATLYQYDHRGNLDRTVDPNGTITRTVYDGLGREVSTWIGTDDTPTTGFWSPTNLAGTDMVQLIAEIYDNGGVGDSNLTETIAYPGGSATPRVSEMFYDWRDREVAGKNGVLVDATTGLVTTTTLAAEATDGVQRAISYSVYDNLGETTSMLVYAGNGIDISSLYVAGVPGQPDASLLRAESTTAYDDQGREYSSSQYFVDQSTGAVGSAVTTDEFYDSRSELIASVDPLGRTITYAFDSLGRQTSVTSPDPDGTGPEAAPVSSSTYDADSNVLTQTDALGNVTTYSYDAALRQTSVTQPDPDGVGPETSPVTTYSFDAAGNTASVTDPLGRVTSYLYDSLGRNTTTTLPDPDGAGPLAAPVYSSTFDGNGNVVTQIDALGNVTATTYDVFNRQTSVTRPDPDGAGPETAPVSSATYDNLGEVLTATDPLGRVTSYDYKVLGQQITVTMPDPDGAGPEAAPVYATSYTVLGNVETTTDALGNVTANAYDGLGRLSETIAPSPDGVAAHPTTSYAYDDDGEMTSTTDPLGRTTSYQYDNLGRQTVVTMPDPDGSGPLAAPETETSYDAVGDVLSTTDALGNVTSFGYDNLYRQISVTQASPDGIAAGPVTSFTFDADSNKTSETDPNGNVTSWTYDNLNREVGQSEQVALYQSGSTVITTTATSSFAYDAVGNFTQKTDADGQVTDFSYDNLYRETGEKWFNSAVDEAANTDATNMIIFSYDLDNEMLTASDAFSSYAYSYDNLGRMTSVDNAGTAGVPNVVLASSYDFNSNRIGLSATIDGTADFVNGYSYDNLNRMIEVTQTGVSGGNAVAEKRIDFSLDAAGETTFITRYADLSGTSLVAESDYGYDNMGRLSSLTHVNGSTTYAGYGWQYDANSQVTQFTNSQYVAEDTNYSYDNNGQLTGASLPNNTAANETDSYDPNGNSTNAGSVVGAGNVILSDGTYSYASDANGNIAIRTNITTGDQTFYQYDNRNRLLSVTDKDSSGTIMQVVDYTYDMFGQLIGRDFTPYTAGVAGSTVTARYVFDGQNMTLAFDGTGALTDRNLSTAAVDQVFADEQFIGSLPGAMPTAPGNTLWALGDNQGTIRDLIDSTGALQDHITYDSFGAPLTHSAAAIDYIFGHTGNYYDPATGLQWNLNRWYDPVLQRWMSQDPLGLTPDSNPYRYVGNRCPNETDPTGLEPHGGPDRPVYGALNDIGDAVSYDTGDISASFVADGSPTINPNNLPALAPGNKTPNISVFLQAQDNKWNTPNATYTGCDRWWISFKKIYEVKTVPIDQRVNKEPFNLAAPWEKDAGFKYPTSSIFIDTAGVSAGPGTFIRKTGSYAVGIVFRSKKDPTKVSDIQSKFVYFATTTQDNKHDNVAANTGTVQYTIEGVFPDNWAKLLGVTVVAGLTG